MSHQEAGCRWETVLDVVDYEVAPWKETLAAHHTGKAVYAAPAYHADRAKAREEVWAMRHGVEDVEAMFSVEAKVPAALLGGVDSHLWEPAWSF